MTNAASEKLISTIAVLPDQVLLEQTRMLARHEQALQLSVLDHLREIEARRLYLRLGYSSLFDYTVRELHYTEAAAWRRIKAMRLCRETRGVRDWLHDGSLNLSNAALLQNSFERWDRSGAGPVAAGSPGAGTNGAPRAGSAPSAARGEAAGAPLPVLDARARQQLVERAVGKSTRQVQQMLAELDPEAAAPAERLRALGNGRWELRAVIDAECQRGLQQLRELMSHVDPHLTIGQLVGRLVREGVARYDPSRPRGRKRRESDPSDEERSSVTAGRETADRVAAAAANRRRAGNSAAPTRSPSAPKRSAKQTADGTSPATLPAGGGSGGDSPKRRLGPPPGSRTSATKLVAPRLPSAPAARWRQSGLRREAPRSSRQFDSGSELPRRRIGGATSAAKPRVAAGSSTPDRSAAGAGSARRTAAAKSTRSAGRSIPAEVKREVWRRDQGCCTYVDRHTGRRCGSRFFLEMDHIVPVALGGGAAPGNLRLRCAAHHRYRHGRRLPSAPHDAARCDAERQTGRGKG